MKKSRLYTILIVASILLFPSLLYVVFTTGEHHIAKMEVFGPETEKGLFVVPEASFYSHLGDSISTADLANSIIIYNFFCLDCSDSSARNALLIMSVMERFLDKKDIKYVTINLTPSNWSNAAVTEYVNPFNIQTDRWFFVNQDSAYLANFVHDGLLINSVYDDNKKSYGPGMASIVIVDKQQHIRGYFDGNQYIDQSSIIDVIKRVRLEEYQKNAKRREDNFERRRTKK
ncbi:MAG: protein SCO1/2 [Salibacteraceae bacterium]|jgi:protein SCO1/2